MKRILIVLLALLLCASCALADIVVEVGGKRMERMDATREYNRLLREGKKAQALEIMYALARAGDLNAMYSVGMANVDEERLYWLEYAAMDGHTGAMLALYEEYQYTNEELALHYLKEAAAGGDTDACYLLGELYLFGGMGIEPDYDKARPLIRAAADERDCRAMYYVAYGKEHGLYGYARDEAAAASTYMFLWEIGDTECWQYGEALDNLGKMYEDGRGVRRDDEMAFELYEQAHQHVMNCGPLLKMARMHAEGRGTKQDVRRAWEILDALRDDAPGYDGDWAYLMGLMYHNGYGTQKNKTLAEAYFEQAQEWGVSLW